MFLYHHFQHSTHMPFFNPQCKQLTKRRKRNSKFIWDSVPRKGSLFYTFSFFSL